MTAQEPPLPRPDEINVTVTVAATARRRATSQNVEGASSLYRWRTAEATQIIRAMADQTEANKGRVVNRSIHRIPFLLFSHEEIMHSAVHKPCGNARWLKGNSRG